MEIFEGEYLYLIIKEIPAYYCEILKKEGDLIKTTIPKRGSDRFKILINQKYTFQQNKLDTTIIFDGIIKEVNNQENYIIISAIKDSLKIHPQRQAIRIPLEIKCEIYFLSEENEVKFRKKGDFKEISLVGGSINFEDFNEEIEKGSKIYIEFLLNNEYLTILGEVKNLIKDENNLKLGFQTLHILPEDEMRIMDITRRKESRL
jgi:hypothetical protein